LGAGVRHGGASHTQRAAESGRPRVEPYWAWARRIGHRCGGWWRSPTAGAANGKAEARGSWRGEGWLAVEGGAKGSGGGLRWRAVVAATIEGGGGRRHQEFK
jgi:hypothetical protein